MQMVVSTIRSRAILTLIIAACGATASTCRAQANAPMLNPAINSKPYQTVDPSHPLAPELPIKRYTDGIEAHDKREADSIRQLESGLRKLQDSLRKQRDEIRMEKEKSEIAILAAEKILKRMLAQESSQTDSEPADERAPSSLPTETGPPPVPVSQPTDLIPTESDAVLLEHTMRAITTGRVDRLALANNLFAAGKHAVSLRVYQAIVPETKDAAELAWLHLQIGNIYRHANVVDKSEKHYRMVTGLGVDTPYYEYARWWLTNLEERANLLNQIEELRTAIKSIEGSTT